MRRVDEILKWVQGPQILDVGCTDHEVHLDSPYWIHGRLRKQYQHVYGIDLSAENIALMRARGFDNLSVQSAETFELPERFNTIVAGELIEHLSNPGRFLDRARAHLAPGGRVILTTPYAFGLIYAIDALFSYPKTCRNPEHTVWFCPTTLQALTERSGFVVEHFQLTIFARPDNPSAIYRFYWGIMNTFRALIPDRLRCDTMLIVLKAA